MAEPPAPAPTPAARGPKLQPLLVAPALCRGATAAGRSRRCAALLVAALATLAVPLAVRRMIDFGFTHQGMNLIDSYFAVMIAVAGVLAVASAARYYLVITLGERIVADLRSDVFNHLTALSVSYFDQTKTGEMLSRLTADTTQIKSAVGSSVSVALRNIVLFVGADHHDGDHEPAAVAVRADRDPGDRAAALRLRARDPAARAAPRRTRSPTRRPMPASCSAACARCRPSPTRAWRAAASRRRSSAPSRPRKARPARARC